MSSVLACILGVMMLVVSGCSRGGGDDEGPRAKDVKASVDSLAMRLLPALAKEFDGEFPLAQGTFVGCNLGRDVKRYVASGDLQAEAADNAKAARRIRATMREAGVDARIGRASTVNGTLGGLAIVVKPNVVSPTSFVAIRPLTIASECHRFSESEVVRINRTRPEVYGQPLTGVP